MFNIGPGELVILAIVAVIVLGPERLPKLARDAANLLRTLREMATGARTQLREELGPEFADLDFDELRRLNPRTAISRAILGDERDGIRADLRKLDPREDLREGFRDADPRADVRRAVNGYRDNINGAANGYRDEVNGAVSFDKPVTNSEAQRPLARGEAAPYDEDAT